jgi:hypothetical protein
MDKKFVKLSELVNDTFTVEKAWGYTFKMWDNDTKKMLTSDTFQQGYRKIYSVDTDKGKLDLGSGQLSSLLEAVYKDGKADINGRTYEVKSNGKTGMDIRYFFNPIKVESRSKEPEIDEIYDNPINLDDIPF